MRHNANEHAAALVYSYDDDDDSENDYEDDFDYDISSVASSIFSDYDPFLMSDHSTLESIGEVMSNLDILEQVEQQKRSTGLEYEEDKSEEYGGSDDDDSVESESVDDGEDEEIDNSSVQSFIKSSFKSARSRRAREEAEAAAAAKAIKSNEEMSFKQYLTKNTRGEGDEHSRQESNLNKEGSNFDDESSHHDGVFSSHIRSHSQHDGKQIVSNRTLKSRSGVSSRPKAKYASRSMRRYIRHAGGFNSGDDSNEELIGSTGCINVAIPDIIDSAGDITFVKALCIESPYRSLCCNSPSIILSGDDDARNSSTPLPGSTKLGRRNSLSDYIDPSPPSSATRSGRSKDGKIVRAPLDFRRLIVLVAISAAMTLAICLSKHGMGHVDRQIAKQIEELERRAKEMESPSEKLRMEMYAKSLENTLQTTDSSKEDSNAADPINEHETTDTPRNTR